MWLENISPKDLNSMPLVLKRIEECKKVRKNSVAKGIQKFAETPMLFAQITQPNDVDYIIVPRVSSVSRKYILIGFMSSDTKVTDSVQIIPNATLYEFGILTSSTHIAWVKTVCGRLKSDYRYSKDVVYNNFPWCTPTDKQKAKIEKTAQAILDARALSPDSSLADLYNELTMPKELRNAHNDNDTAVRKAYGFDKAITEPECVAKLMEMYLEITGHGRFINIF